MYGLLPPTLRLKLLTHFFDKQAQELKVSVELEWSVPSNCLLMYPAEKLSFKIKENLVFSNHEFVVKVDKSTQAILSPLQFNTKYEFQINMFYEEMMPSLPASKWSEPLTILTPSPPSITPITITPIPPDLHKDTVLNIPTKGEEEQRIKDAAKRNESACIIQSIFRGYCQRQQWLKLIDQYKLAAREKESSVFNVDTLFILEISVKKGSNLPSKKSNDSFVRVKCDNQVFDTTVIKNSLDPEWNGITRFRFGQAPKIIYFNVFNGEDKQIDHQLIGYYQQSLDGYFIGDNPGKCLFDKQCKKYTNINTHGQDLKEM